MAKSPVAVDVAPAARASGPSRLGAAPGGAGFDWLMAGLGAWLIGGLYLDGWAHIHVPNLESFFTPWHAVLYSGYLAGAATRSARRSGGTVGRAHHDRPPCPLAIDALVGVFVFFFAGVADMLWHVVFGIEDGVEGLISPSHLALALGGGLIVTGRSELGCGARRGRSGRGSRGCPWSCL